MYVDANTIIQAAAFLGAVTAIGAMLYKSFKWMEQQKQQEDHSPAAP